MLMKYNIAAKNFKFDPWKVTLRQHAHKEAESWPTFGVKLFTVLVRYLMGQKDQDGYNAE